MKIEIWEPRSAERAAVRVATAIVDWRPVTEKVADRAGELAGQFRWSHHSVDRDPLEVERLPPAGSC